MTSSPAPQDATSARLQDSWQADLALLAPEAPPALRTAEGTRLLSRWSEPHRHYHTVHHLSEVLAALAELTQAGAVDAIGARQARVATWYHDAVYDPRATAGSNEHRSAALARDHLHALGAAPGTVDVIEALVLLTVEHNTEAASSVLASRRHTAAVLHDADLWILSASRARYREYAAQVRAEYAHVPPDLFAQGRATILSGFAQRAEIYRTAHARAHWQARARENLSAELDALRA